MSGRPQRSIEPPAVAADRTYVPGTARRRCAVSVAAALATLAFVGTAGADREKIRLTTAGQQAARANVVTRADLGTAGVWKGGARKPSPDSTSSCPGFDPKLSDLVINGEAETRWQSSGIQIVSEADVLETERMLRLEWRRTVLAPQFLRCLRTGVRKQSTSTARLVSVEHIAFPKLARYTAAFRVLIDVKTATGKVRVMSDLVFFGAGRTGLSLLVSAPLAASAVVRQAEVRLVTLLVSRIQL